LFRFKIDINFSEVIILDKNNQGYRGSDPQPDHGKDNKGHQDKGNGPKERGRDVLPGNSGALTALWKFKN
jgi:hypothetical protein